MLLRPLRSTLSRCSSRLFDASRYVSLVALLRLAGSLRASLLLYLMSRKDVHDWIKSLGRSRERFLDKLIETISLALEYSGTGMVMRFLADKSTWLSLAPCR